jgi:uncharacterized membrane protein HdeD (DUF308 family)
MSTLEPQGTPGTIAPGLQELRRNAGLLLALGIAELLLGVIALGVVGMVTLVSVIFFGWLLIFSGVAHLVRAFRTRGWEGVSLHLLIGILQAAVGVLMLARPVAGAASLTLLLAALFTVSGLFRIGIATMTRIHGWGWQVLSGLVALLLGLFITAGWPASSLWVIGTFIGIDLIFGGWSFIMIALAARRLATPVAAAV